PDSTHTGACATPGRDKVDFKGAIGAPQQPATVMSESFLILPPQLQNADGSYNGRVVLDMVLDSAGKVVPGSVSVESSTDAKLSDWACEAALKIRFVPARQAGKAV